MCQGFIGKVISVDKDSITVEYNGEELRLNSKLLNANMVNEGDYVLFSSDLAIDKVDKDEAEMMRGESDGNRR